MDIVVFLEWLNAPAFSWLGNPLSHAEAFGFATGLLCVWLTVRKNIWNFPVGILNSALLFLLFWEGRLFADATLQILFISLSAIGWWQWAWGRVNHVIPVSQLDGHGLAKSIVAAVLLTVALFGLLTWVRGSIPVFDALITGLSLVAQYMLNQRKLESWFFWIAVDVISIPVYAYKELYLIALLYTVFLGLCVLGYREWRQSLSTSPAHGEAVEPVA